jgi:hypothetical protein
MFYFKVLTICLPNFGPYFVNLCHSISSFLQDILRIQRIRIWQVECQGSESLVLYDLYKACLLNAKNEFNLLVKYYAFLSKVNLD